MSATCRDCGRPLRRPSPDGLGPRCRRKLRTPPAGGPAQGDQPALDHAGLAAAGQLAIPIQPTLPARPLWADRLPGRRADTLPDIATYQPQGPDA
ncbi:hypothetical protein [Streptomyces youssoufiensis]